jgi:hypothetical protein
MYYYEREEVHVSQTIGYMVDMQGATFDEDGAKWIQALPLGKYEHPTYGELNITEERCQRFADSVTQKVRGTDLDIDYDHKVDTKIAAGWVKEAQARGAQGLFLKVQFTEKARRHLAEKEYRYFSAEFQDEWPHPKTGVVHKDVLFGGALTNRPFIKDITPINLSEVFDDARKSMTAQLSEEGKAIRTKLGLSADASDSDVLAALDKIPPTSPTPTTPPAPPAPSAPPVDAVATAAVLTEVKQLAETVKAMKEKQEVDAKELAELRKRDQVLKANATIDSMVGNLDGRRALSPAAREAAQKIMLGEDVADNTTALLQAVTSGSAIVELGERGRARTGGDKNGVQAFTDAIAAARAADVKLSYGDAVNKVLSENPALAVSYRESLMAGEGVS